MEPKVDFGTEISGPEQLLAMRCVPRIERAVAKTNHLVILSYYVPPVFFFLLKVFLKIILFQLRFQNRELSMDVRLGALRLYRQHLVSQYSDRCAFWSLRDISAETFSRCITIMTDGADQDITFVFYSFSSCNFKNYFSVT